MSHSLDLEGRTVAAVISDITSPTITSVTRHKQPQQQSQSQLHTAAQPSTTQEVQDVATTELSEEQTTPTTPPTQLHQDAKEVGSSTAVIITMVVGATAGAVAKTSIAPLDRTKIYFQATKKRFSARHALTFLVESYKNDGLLSLWRGNSATMARIIPYASIQFTAHEQYKKLLHIDSPNQDTPSSKRFLAGSLAGVTSQSLTYPLDMARARMAVTKKGTYSSLAEVFVKIWKYEGPLTLYRGLTPTLIGVIPYAGTSFGIYETLKSYHRTNSGKDKPNPLERMLFGAIAGLVGQSSSYPLDIVRRRMQTAKVTGNGNSYKTIVGTLVKVYREEGVFHGLYKGLSMNWIKGPIAVGISFATFDTLKLTLEQIVNAR